MKFDVFFYTIGDKNAIIKVMLKYFLVFISFRKFKDKPNPLGIIIHH